MTDKERELFTQALKLITELDKEGLVLEMGLILEMRAALAQPEPICRDDGRCQYAIDHGAEGMGHCPVGKCCMPQPEQEPDQQPEQEPVAWLYNGHLHECDPSEWAVTDVTPLYKLPPHKPWVGLTDGEINTIANSPQPIDETSSGYVLPFAHAIEARLKEINR